MPDERPGYRKLPLNPAPWVHLDIAGTAWLDDGKPYLAKGPSGVTVRTMVRLAMEWKA